MQPFHLTGNFAPIPHELTVTDLPVNGSIPLELSGTYMRNEPPATAPRRSGSWARACCTPCARKADEDDGFVISFVYDRELDLSELAICDARDFTAPALATVRLPARVPFGIHGNWFPVEPPPQPR